MEYQRLTMRNVIGLAAPHTWVAAVFPVLLGTALSIVSGGAFSPLLFATVLPGVILMQASVNTLNDYCDFVRGTDRVENSDDPTDAVLVYNRLNPQHVKRLGAAFLAAGLILGIYAMARGGLVATALALTGAAVIVAYSAGRFRISALPLGEAVSGVVMGGMITVAVFAAFTGNAGWHILLLSAPCILGIGLINMTNNTCDIERDRPSGRKTLPVLLGRRAAKRVYTGLLALWILLLIALTGLCFPYGAPALVVIGAVAAPSVRRLLRLGLRTGQRGSCMGGILKVNILLHTAYLAAIAVHILVQSWM